MNINRFFRSKLILFCIQILILSLILYIFQYSFRINFDTETTQVHRQIIQFLANYIMYEGWLNLLFIYLIWIFISFIPICLVPKTGLACFHKRHCLGDLVGAREVNEKRLAEDRFEFRGQRHLARVQRFELLEKEVEAVPLQPQAEDPGASPGGSTLATQSRGPTAATLGAQPGNDGSIPSGTT